MLRYSIPWWCLCPASGRNKDLDCYRWRSTQIIIYHHFKSTKAPLSALSSPWFLRSSKVISISGVMTVLTGAENSSVLTNVVNANRINVNRLMIISLPYKSDVLSKILFCLVSSSITFQRSYWSRSIWAMCCTCCFPSCWTSLGFLILTRWRVSFKFSGFPVYMRG